MRSIYDAAAASFGDDGISSVRACLRRRLRGAALVNTFELLLFSVASDDVVLMLDLVECSMGVIANRNNVRMDDKLKWRPPPFSRLASHDIDVNERHNTCYHITSL